MTVTAAARPRRASCDATRRPRAKSEGGFVARRSGPRLAEFPRARHVKTCGLMLPNTFPIEDHIAQRDDRFGRGNQRHNMLHQQRLPAPSAPRKNVERSCVVQLLQQIVCGEYRVRMGDRRVLDSLLQFFAEGPSGAICFSRDGLCHDSSLITSCVV